MRHPGSRTGLSLEDIETIVFPELRQMLFLDGYPAQREVTFCVPTITIANVCGNMFLPEWQAVEKLPEWAGDMPKNTVDLPLANRFQVDMTDIRTTHFTTPGQYRNDSGFRTVILFAGNV